MPVLQGKSKILFERLRKFSCGEEKHDMPPMLPCAKGWKEKNIPMKGWAECMYNVNVCIMHYVCIITAYELNVGLAKIWSKCTFTT